MSLHRILAIAAKTKRRTFPATIRYRRGALVALLSVGVGRTQWEAVDDDGKVLRCESRDFFVLASELVLGGKRVEPQRLDLIEELCNGEVAFTQEVMPVQDNQYFRYLDQLRVEMRVHTQRKG